MSLRPYLPKITLVIIACSTLGVIQGCNATSTTQVQTQPTPTPSIPGPPPTIDIRNYTKLRKKLNHDRTVLWKSYQRAKNTAERETIIDQARESILRSVHREIIPFWYGTKWDFYGTTETPGEGQIACGYFVTTVLRDVGLKLERARLAQQASENIILSLTTNTHIRRFRRVSINTFVDTVRSWGTGLYIVGLDNHVGFILSDAGEVSFIHSSYADPYSVVNERALESRILIASRYRVLGKLSEDDELILKWLKGDQFVTRAS